jgi:hypothetical protein
MLAAPSRSPAARASSSKGNRICRAQLTRQCSYRFLVWGLEGIIVMMRKIAAIFGGLCLAVFASDAPASTLTYYYVGAPYTVSNVPVAPLMTTGSLTIDATQLRGGSPAGHRVLNYIEGFNVFEQIRTPEFISVTMNEATSGLGVDVRFDLDGRIDTWNVYHLPYDAYCFANCYLGEGDATLGGGYDGFRGLWYTGDHWSTSGFMIDPNVRHTFLSGLGYTDTMAQYWDYFDDELLWSWVFYSPEPGQWFDNLNDFARQIEINTQVALANPARSIYDIAPIPLPTPVAMLLAGVGALLVAGRRRQTSRPQRS